MKSLFAPVEDYLRRASSIQQQQQSQFSFKSEIDIPQSITIAIFDISFVKDDSYTSTDTTEQGVITCLATWNDSWLKTILSDECYYQPQWQSTILSHATGIIDDQISNGLLLSRIKVRCIILFSAHCPHILDVNSWEW